MARNYTVRDLVDAQVNALRFAGAHPDLESFHSARYRAMARAFGVPAAREGREGRELESLERSAVELLVGLDSPFSGYLEAPRSVRELHARFGRQINAGIEQTKAAVADLLAAVVVRRYGIPEGLAVGRDDLLRHGFDPSTPWPDEFDYF